MMSGGTRKNTKERVAFHAFWLCAALLIFVGGMAAVRYQFFPSKIFPVVERGYQQLFGNQPKTGAEFRKYAGDTSRPAVRNTPQTCDGLNLVTHITTGEALSVKVMDNDGRKLHEWVIDWFKIWPDAAHLPNYLVPKSPPGTQVHGVVLLENGNLIFNFEYLGLVCLDFDGNVLWRLPYQTHHSLTRADDGNLWVCGRKKRQEPVAEGSGIQLPFDEDTLLEVTPEGKISHEWSVVDLLQKNGKEGLLYVGSNRNRYPIVKGDIFHLNDVEPFSSIRMKEGYFQKGDILVSLRNINTIFVFNRNTEKIKFIDTGTCVRQHDPDFVDGDTISVFDNHSIGPNEAPKAQSRIVLISAPDRAIKTIYQGAPNNRFYSAIMGKHQWLPNGNLLITQSCAGKAFEIDPQGKTVWEYNNFVEKGFVNLVEEVTRLPPSYASLFQVSKSNR